MNRRNFITRILSAAAVTAVPLPQEFKPLMPMEPGVDYGALETRIMAALTNGLDAYSGGITALHRAFPAIATSVLSRFLVSGEIMAYQSYMVPFPDHGSTKQEFIVSIQKDKVVQRTIIRGTVKA